MKGMKVVSQYKKILTTDLAFIIVRLCYNFEDFLKILVFKLFVFYKWATYKKQIDLETIKKILSVQHFQSSH